MYGIALLFFLFFFYVLSLSYGHFKPFKINVYQLYSMSNTLILGLDF
jgi:hypothetical protein